MNSKGAQTFLSVLFKHDLFAGRQEYLPSLRQHFELIEIL